MNTMLGTQLMFYRFKPYCNLPEFDFCGRNRRGERRRLLSGISNQILAAVAVAVAMQIHDEEFLRWMTVPIFLRRADFTYQWKLA